MNKLFIHHPLFRLLSPLFSGVLVYLLVLLVNNNVEQLYEQFLSDELYFCIGLSFIIQELSRLLVVLFRKYAEKKGRLFLFLQMLASLIVCISAVTIAIYFYYKNILGFTPNIEELWLFNSIFSVVTLIYILLSVSHQYLHKINSKKLNEELTRKQLIEEDFVAFKNEINPNLLFGSLEAMISLMKHQKDNLDDLVDNLASTYRYILSKNKRQLVLIEEEQQVLGNFVQLNNYLPSTNITINNELTSSFMVVPGSLIKIIELIIKGSIIDYKEPLAITFKEDDEKFMVSYKHNDKIVDGISQQDFDELKRVYTIYNSKSLQIEDNKTERVLNIPKLHIKS